MIFKMKLLMAAVIILSTLSAKAQDLEVGVIGGLAGYIGDYTPMSKISTYLSLGNKKNKGFGFDNWTTGAFARMEFNQKSPSFLAKNAGIRFNFTHTALKGAASDGVLLFDGKINEMACLYELNFRSKPKQAVSNFWNPYFVAGAGLSFFNVENYVGLGKENSSSFSIPVGVGIKYYPQGLWMIGLELFGRLINDDIDGGNRANRFGFDGYKTLSLRVGYTIPGQYL